MPIPSTGYAIASIAALKALAATDRTDGYSRQVVSDPNGLPAWYTFRALSTVAGDENEVIVPADNPSEGRWLKTGASLTGALAAGEKGAVNGVATLDATGTLPNTQLPPIVITELGLIQQSVDPDPIAEQTLIYSKPDNKIYQRSPDGAIAELGAGVSNVPSSSAKILTSDTYWAVDPVNGNDANSGELSAPFATLKKASFVAADYINPDGYTRTITLLPGTHNGAKLTGFINCGTDDYILIKGSTEGQSTPPTISGVDCLSFAATGIYKLEFLKLVGTETVDGNCLCINNARVKIGNEVEFGETTNNHIVGFNHATIEVLGDYQITGNAGVAHIFLDSFSFLDTSYLAFPVGRQITLTPGIALAKFAVLKRSSYLSAIETAFNGSSSGQKFDVSSSSTIDTNTGDATLFPGNTAGVLTTGGQYF